MTGASMLRRGRANGFMLMLLGAWGAIVLFVGPYFGYAYTPDKTWTYTTGRLWLCVLPGAAAFLGGLLVLASSRTAAAGAMLAALGGAWFVVGQPIAAVAWTSRPITPGTPAAVPGAVFGPAMMRFLEGLGCFYGLGVVILFVAALALGEAVVMRLAAERYRERMAEVLEHDDGYGPVY